MGVIGHSRVSVEEHDADDEIFGLYVFVLLLVLEDVVDDRELVRVPETADEGAVEAVDLAEGLGLAGSLEFLYFLRQFRIFRCLGVGVRGVHRVSSGDGGRSCGFLRFANELFGFGFCGGLDGGDGSFFEDSMEASVQRGAHFAHCSSCRWKCECEGFGFLDRDE